MRVELQSPCKVNLILNILGKRADGFHNLETVMHPVAIYDFLELEQASSGIELTCNKQELPTDSRNLVYRAATAFFSETRIQAGIRIHLEKRIPMEAGLGGGSGNAATALLGLNQVFGSPLDAASLQRLAAELGSDVPFFLQKSPAFATGRGENVTSLPSFCALAGYFFFLVHPGFGVSTPWAYKNLVRFDSALNGAPGRAERLVRSLQVSVETAKADFYNSLEAPVLEKYPLLKLFQEFLLANGAAVALMSGSGSTTFALVKGAAEVETLAERFRSKFGNSMWTATVEVRQK